MSCSRREFLKVSAGTLVAGMLPLPALASVLESVDTKRTLGFFNTHTNEKLKVCYFDGDGYRPEALDRINFILRDFRADEILPIDPLLLDQLFALRTRIQPRTPFHIISGYRAPTTNAMLRRTTSGVARASMHTRGRAVDIRLPGYSTCRLRDVSIALNAGGVGYYPNSDFVHLDTGRVRAW